MDKQEYLSITVSRLEELTADETFIRDLAQVRAKAIQEELVPEQPSTRFTFDDRKIWKYCDFIFSEGALLLKEDFGESEKIFSWIRTAGQAFEFLANITNMYEREILLLNSAMCYHIAGYQANAQCLTKRVENKFLTESTERNEKDSADQVLTRLFRQTLVFFLQRDISKLQQSTARAISSIQDLQVAITRDVADHTGSITRIFDLTAHAYFHQALTNVVTFCLFGNRDGLSNARQELQKSNSYFQKVNDTTLGSITSELRTVLDLFEERSTWSNISRHAEHLLASPVWRLYLRNLAFEKSIVEFWISQLRAIGAGILTGTDSYVVQMPTSAGKTLIAELSILAALTMKRDSRCLYIAPYRALVSEIEKTLSETLGSVGFRVSNLLGGFEYDAFQNFLLTNSDVLVATPEKVELFYRTHPDYFENLSVVVVDEGHVLGDGIAVSNDLDDGNSLFKRLTQQGTLGRGPLLELLITRLKRKLPETRFVFLSAVMPDVNATDFVSWLTERGDEPLKIARAERPSRQVIAKFEWLSKENGQLEYLNLPTLADNRRPFVPYFIKRRQYVTGELTPTGKAQRKSWPDVTSKTQTTATLAARFAKAGPVLVFCAQVNDVKGVAGNIVTTLRYLEASEQSPSEALRYTKTPELESHYLALEWFGEEHILTQALRFGVGMHYGLLPDPLRQAIEDEFRSGKLRILVSTNTLAQGVNMPIKTAIIYSLERRWIDDAPGKDGSIHTSKVPKRDFWNICGRAGRAGLETEGQIVFVVISENDQRLVEEYKDYNVEEIDSALFQLLKALIQQRLDQKDLIGYLDSHVLAMLAEEVVDLEDEKVVTEFLGSSLVGVQALRTNNDIAPLVSAIINTAAWIVDQVPEKDFRAVFSTTGLQVASCQMLLKTVDSYQQQIIDELSETESSAVVVSELLLSVAIEACRDLPELTIKKPGNYYGPDNEFDIISAWVSGKPIANLRVEHWDSDQGEALSEYISDRLSYRFPWGVNGFLQILAARLGLEYDTLPLPWQHLPSMVKFGVDNVIACWAYSLAVSSRNLAQQLADLYQIEDKGLSFTEFLTWLVDLPTDFIFDVLEGSRLEKQRLIKNIYGIISSEEQLELISRGIVDLVSPIQGIAYENRQAVATQVSERDQLILEMEPDNPYDPYAVKVLFSGKHLGYVKRDKARILTKEMLLGREILAYATQIKPATATYPFQQITMTITIS